MSTGEPRDPFTAHLAFLDRHWPSPPTTGGDRPGFEPVDPIDTKADKLIDIETLERIASWAGMFKEPREMRADEYPAEVEDALEIRMAQFHLRNIGRAERTGDPDNLDDLRRRQLEYGLALQEPVGLTEPYETPELLPEMLLDVGKGHQGDTHQLFVETEWEEHFCREIREKWNQPLWRYDPEQHRDQLDE